MKKLFFGLFVLGIFSLTSCKKDRTCECKTNGNVVQSATFNDASKRTAKDACISRSFEDGSGKTVKVECELK